jgi:hypothetical protein
MSCSILLGRRSSTMRSGNGDRGRGGQARRRLPGHPGSIRLAAATNWRERSPRCANWDLRGAERRRMVAQRWSRRRNPGWSSPQTSRSPAKSAMENQQEFPRPLRANLTGPIPRVPPHGSSRGYNPAPLRGLKTARSPVSFAPRESARTRTSFSFVSEPTGARQQAAACWSIPSGCDCGMALSVSLGASTACNGEGLRPLRPLGFFWF